MRCWQMFREQLFQDMLKYFADNWRDGDATIVWNIRVTSISILDNQHHVTKSKLRWYKRVIHPAFEELS